MGLTDREQVLMAVLNRQEKQEVVTVQQIHANLEDGPSLRTVQNALNGLVEVGQLVSIGGTGSASCFYRFADDEQYPHVE